MRKICVVLTARASYGKIKPILQAIKDHPDLELQFVCAASAVLDRFGSADKMAEADGFKVNERIYMVLEAETLLTSARSTGLGVMDFAAAFERLAPDVVLVMADRYEVISAAIAASYLNIPLAHAQGGEISGNIDEKVRHAVTKLADIHFPSTQLAREWIIRMGEDPDTVFFTGCPSIDIVKDIVKNPTVDFSPYSRYGGVGKKPDLSNGYIIVMQHPVTTEYGHLRPQIRETLRAFKDYPKPVLWFWPNVDAGGDDVSKEIRHFREIHALPQFHFFKNMEPEHFLRLLYNSDGIAGNSSVAIRESSYLGVPALDIGNRQLHRHCGPNVLRVAHDAQKIQEAAAHWFGNKKETSNMFGDGTAGIQIADILSKVPLKFFKTLHYVFDKEEENESAQQDKRTACAR